MKRICVFCGSRPGNRPEYLDSARRLGRVMAERGIGLVYGGASVGLMGETANAVLDAGGQVIGVIPQALVAREIAHRGLSELHVVDGMHARKAMMAELSDAFISMPGGLGTFEELFEVITWAQLGLHRKASGLLNVHGFYDHLLGLVDHAVAEGFILPENRALFVIEETPERLLDVLAVHKVPEPARKWIAPAET